MKTKLKAYLIWKKYDWEEKPEYSLSHSDMSGCGPNWIAVSQSEYEVEIPDDFNPAPQQIEILKAQKTTILANAHVQAENIEEQIQRLLCIEHKPEKND